MHILLLPTWYSTIDKPWRGTFVCDQATALARDGHQVGVAFVERRSLSRLSLVNVLASHFQTTSREEDGLTTIRMKGWSTFAQTVRGSMIWARLTRRLVRSYVDMHGVPDVIHGHTALWGGYASMLAAAELQRPYIVTEHSSSILTGRLSAEERAYASEVYNGAASVIAVSGALAERVDEIAGRQVAQVLPNTVDTDYFHAPRFTRRRDPFTFVAVCDLVDYKRVDRLIGAFARLRVRRPDARLVVVGAGKQERALRGLAHALAIEDHVEFTGALPRWCVRQQMWDANALVLPSAYETFGVVLIEALSTGIPVIATRCGGPEEIVTPEVGMLVDRDDDVALMSAMEATMVKRYDASAIRDAARARFGYEVVSRRLRSIYSRVASHWRHAA